MWNTVAFDGYSGPNLNMNSNGWCPAGGCFNNYAAPVAPAPAIAANNINTQAYFAASNSGPFGNPYSMAGGYGGFS